MRIAAITDEFSPDLEVAVKAMAAVGMTGAELRVVWGKNVVDLTNDDVDRARAIVEAHGMTVISIASPVLKCVLPDAPAVDERYQQDVFGSKHTFADQPLLAARAFEICARTGARMLRVFSYWRTVDPARLFRSDRRGTVRARRGRAAPRHHRRPRKRARLQRQHR